MNKGYIQRFHQNSPFHDENKEDFETKLLFWEIKLKAENIFTGVYRHFDDFGIEIP